MPPVPEQPRTPTPQLPGDLFDTPRLYLREIAPPRMNTALFLPMSRQTYADTSFLDARTIPTDGRAFRVSLGAVLDRFQSELPPLRATGFIFHTAFCGSTLLARALDKPGASLAYKEPFLLHQLAEARRLGVPEAMPAPDGSAPELIRMATALLSRTFAPAEVPIVKVTDSCGNLARELLEAHPGSSGILLHFHLGDFIVAMLKRPRRRAYMRRMTGRAAIDLRNDPDLASIKPDSLSDPQAAAYVWLALMRQYIALLEDQNLDVRSLDARVFYENPAQTIAAAARLFGIDILDAEARSIAVGPVFTRDAKNPAKPFDARAKRRSLEQQRQDLADEVAAGVAWSKRITAGRPIPDPLPRPLI